MPVDVDFAGPDRFLVRCSGEVTLAEIEVAFETMTGHLGKRPGADMFVDARTVEGVPSTPELRIVASDLKPLIAKGLGPIGVATATTFVYGVARMFGVFAEAVGAKYSAFRDLDETQKWLDAQRAGSQKPN